MIEQALYTILKDDSGVSALVGTRIDPVVLPQQPTYPAITYRRSGVSQIIATQGGRQEIPAFEVSAYDETYSGVKALADAVRTAMRGDKGFVDGFTVQDIEYQNEFDGFDNDLQVYSVTFTYEIWFCE